MKYYFAVILSVILSVSQAQEQKVITGEVRDSLSGEVLPFTNISFKGYNTGTVSNAEGRYSLNTGRLADSDTLIFTFLGYAKQYRTVAQLKAEPVVYMRENSIALGTVTVRYKQMTVKEILEKTVANYSSNYGKRNSTDKFYYHSDIQTVFNNSEFKLKKSDISFVDKKLFKKINDVIPDTTYTYGDLLGQMYRYEDESKLVNLKAMCLVDDFDVVESKEIENIFNEHSGDPDIYWKARTGIFGTKIAHDSIKVETNIDTLVSKRATKYERGRIEDFIENNANPIVAEWEFIEKPGKYNYKLERGININNRFAYKISFTPRNRGLYEGEMYISADDFGILKLVYSMAEGKIDHSVHIFGILYREKGKSGTIIYQRDDEGYFPGYIYRKELTQTGINRNVIVKQKRKRLLFDKTLKEVKLSVEFNMDMTSTGEYLLLSRKPLNDMEFSKIEEAKHLKYKKVKRYDTDHWGDYSVIKPTEDILKYKKQFEE